MDNKVDERGKVDFQPGDLIFAKMKSYPPWPAKILDINVLASPSQHQKVCVQFLGTNEIGYIRKQDLFDYAEFRDKLAIEKKIKGFREGLQIIAELYEEQNVPLAASVGNRPTPVESPPAPLPAKSLQIKFPPKKRKFVSEESDDDIPLKVIKCEVPDDEDDVTLSTVANQNQPETPITKPEIEPEQPDTTANSTTVGTPTAEKRIRKSKVFSDDFIVTDPKLRHLLDSGSTKSPSIVGSAEHTVEFNTVRQQRSSKRYDKIPLGLQKKRGRKSRAEQLQFIISSNDETSTLRKSEIPEIDKLVVDTFENSNDNSMSDSENASESQIPILAPMVPDVPAKEKNEEDDALYSSATTTGLKIKLSTKCTKSPVDPESPCASAELKNTVAITNDDSPSVATKPRRFPRIKIGLRPPLLIAQKNSDQDHMPVLATGKRPPNEKTTSKKPDSKKIKVDEQPLFKKLAYYEGFEYYVRLIQANRNKETLATGDQSFDDKLYRNIKDKWRRLHESQKAKYQELAENPEKFQDETLEMGVANIADKSELELVKPVVKNIMKPIKKGQFTVYPPKKSHKKKERSSPVAKLRPSLKAPRLSPVKKKAIPSLSTALPDDFQLILQPMTSSTTPTTTLGRPPKHRPTSPVPEVGGAEARYRWWLYQSSSTTGPQKKASRENSPPRTLTNDAITDTTAMFKILSKTFQQMGNKLMQKPTGDSKVQNNQQAAMVDCLMDGFMVSMVQLLSLLRYAPTLSKCYPKEIIDDLIEKTSVFTPL